MNVCDNMGDHLVGNVYIKVSTGLYVGGTSEQQVKVTSLLYQNWIKLSMLSSFQNHTTTSHLTLLNPVCSSHANGANSEVVLVSIHVIMVWIMWIVVVQLSTYPIYITKKIVIEN